MQYGDSADEKEFKIYPPWDVIQALKHFYILISFKRISNLIPIRHVPIELFFFRSFLFSLDSQYLG